MSYPRAFLVQEVCPIAVGPWANHRHENCMLSIHHTVGCKIMLHIKRPLFLASNKFSNVIVQCCHFPEPLSIPTSSPLQYLQFMQPMTSTWQHNQTLNQTGNAQTYVQGNQLYADYTPRFFTTTISLVTVYYICLLHSL